MLGVLTHVDKSLNVFTVARTCMANYEKCLQSSLDPTFFYWLMQCRLHADYDSKKDLSHSLVGDLV